MWINKVTVDLLQEVIGTVEYKTSYIGDTQYRIALVPCGFDIETTHEFMYVWTTSINCVTIFGSTWGEFKTLLKMLTEVVGAGASEEHISTVLPIYVHNFGGFEWHFLKSQLNFTASFCIGDNALYGVVDEAVLFLDSYRVCPNKLEDLAKMYSSHSKTHDLDYSVERNHNDGKNLTPEEQQYCANDTLILVDFAKHQFEFLKEYGCLPTTQNKMVKSMIDFEYNKDREQNAKIIDHLFPTNAQYTMIRRWGFRGGFCQSSCSEVTEKVGYADLDSAYSSAIVHGYYPMTRYREKVPNTYEQYLDTHCCQMTMYFEGLESKSFVHYEMATHTITKDLQSGLFSNDILRDSANRVVSAKGMIVSLTEIDFKLYQLCYTWKSVKCLKLLVSERGPLPDYVIRVALKLYGDKAVLKKADLEDTQEYKRKKSLPSTIFGAMCQRIYVEDLDMNDTDWYNTFKTKKLMPQWGVYVTAYVRNIMVRMALQMGFDWTYSDTDSFYYDYSDFVKGLLDDFNEEQRAKNKIMCEKYGLDYNVYDNLGCFDYSEKKNLQIDHFKTFGSKAYIYHYTDNKHPDGDIKLVLGGIPKENFWESFRNSGVEDPFDYFSPESEITYRKLVSEQCKGTKAVINGEKMYCKTGVKLKEKVITSTIRDVKNIVVYTTFMSEHDDKTLPDL